MEEDFVSNLPDISQPATTSLTTKTPIEETVNEKSLGSLTPEAVATDTIKVKRLSTDLSPTKTETCDVEPNKTLSTEETKAETPTIIENVIEEPINSPKIESKSDTTGTPLVPSTQTSTLQSEQVVESVVNTTAAPTDTKKENTQNVGRKTTAQAARECINYECAKRPKEFMIADSFILSHFKVPKKVIRAQYVCIGCYEEAIQKYEQLCGTLEDLQPLMLESLPKRADLVEILDSSDEEDNTDASKNTDENADLVPAAVLKLLEDNFEDVLSETLKRIDIDQQMSWNSTILKHNIKKNEEMSNEIAADFKSLQKMADLMYSRLYKNGNYVIEELPPIDLNTNKQMQLAGPTYPPDGPIEYPPIDSTSLYYAVRQKLLAAWIPCKASEQMEALYQGVSFKMMFPLTRFTYYRI